MLAPRLTRSGPIAHLPRVIVGVLVAAVVEVLAALTHGGVEAGALAHVAELAVVVVHHPLLLRQGGPVDVLQGRVLREQGRGEAEAAQAAGGVLGDHHRLVDGLETVGWHVQAAGVLELFGLVGHLVAAAFGGFFVEERSDADASGLGAEVAT